MTTMMLLYAANHGIGDAPEWPWYAVVDLVYLLRINHYTVIRTTEHRRIR